MTDFKSKTCTVIGLGISNTPLIEFLLAQGAKVTARDKKEFDQLPDAVKEYRKKGVEFFCGENYLSGITEDVIFRSPGLRYDKPELAEAVARGSYLTSEMQVFFELCPAKIIGVTGSDGKTTTTTLIYKALCMQYGEDRVFLGGNIGAPLLPRVEKMDSNSFAVVELSSFQLHTMTLSPDISVVTNISPNHLDYHLGMEEYIAAKKNIFTHQKPGSRLVVNAKNSVTAGFSAEICPGCECRTFNGGDLSEKDGVILKNGLPVLAESSILIPGHHNVENYMAAMAALDGIVDNSVFVKLAATFGGVEHRCELVREKDGVKFYNSSIDSSPTRTAAALSSFKEKVIVICGGYDKHIPFEPLAKPLIDHAKTVVLTGATADKICDALVSSPDYKENSPVILRESDFDKAVMAAAKAAVPGDCVILSPACASFDAFKNFEQRGNHFKDLVNKL